jgi:hypothetical protein
VTSVKVLHLFNKQSDYGPGLRNLILVSSEDYSYRSGFWDIPLAEAEALVDGMIYLHTSKAEPSRFGGRVTKVEQEKRPEFAHSARIVFTVMSLEEGKGVRWRGDSHAMAVSGGIQEAND